MTPEELDFGDSNMVDDLLANCNDLRSRAQNAERRNTLLKEKLVEVRARSNYYVDVAGSWGIDLPDNIDEPDKKSQYEIDARDRFRAEMPEVFE